MLKAWKWDYIFLLEALSNSCAYRVPLLSMKWSPTHHHHFHHHDHHHHHYHQYDNHDNHQSGCTFECKLAVGRERTGGCTPWYYPRYVNVFVRHNKYLQNISFPNSSLDTNICDPWQTKVFLEAIFGGVTADKWVSWESWFKSLFLSVRLWKLESLELISQ